MMKSQINRKKVAVLLWLALGTSCGAASAQETTPNQDKADKTRHFIAVKKVPPALLAWQIDPQHQPEPASIARTRKLWQQFNGVPDAPASSHAALPMPERPKGDLLFPLHARALSPSENPPGLLVEADENDLQQLHALVALLDKPVQEIEIGVKVVRVPRKIADYWQRNDGKTFAFADQQGANPSLFPIPLLQMLEKILIATQFSARTETLNNSAALIESETKIGAATDQKTDKLWRFLTIPTVNHDGSITTFVLAASFLRAPTDDPENPEVAAKPTFTQSRLQTIAHLRNSEILVLSGISVEPDEVAGEQVDVEQSMIEVILVTARTLAAMVESKE